MSSFSRFGFLAFFCVISANAFAENNSELLQIKKEIEELKSSYEVRIHALEERLKESEQQLSKSSQIVEANAVVSNPISNHSFNPDVSLILGGTYASFSQDPKKYRIQGFLPSGSDIGPGSRGFNLGESELSLSANVDPNFSGKLTFSLASDNTVSVEEAFFQSQGLSNGVNLKGGRFLSSFGYLNSQHAHAWDFIDAPLVYQAMFGGQYKSDGMQLKWLAPTDEFIEMGIELGNGGKFPGNDRNKNGVGSTVLFAHVGDDIGDSISWRAGTSYLKTSSVDYTYVDPLNNIVNSVNANSNIWALDGVLKWSPNGNGTTTSLKLQTEIFQNRESGFLTRDIDPSIGFRAIQSGGYVQAVYQFKPEWRLGLRHDYLIAKTPSGIGANNFPSLTSYQPRKESVMLDYSPSEFSRFRVQLARDKSRPEVVDNQLMLQYIMSLGTHGAHTY